MHLPVCSSLQVLVIGSFLVLSAIAGAKPVGSVSPVKHLSLPAFVGRWYQTHASKIPLDTFEKNGYCITADYTMTSATQFKVHNEQAMNSHTGPRNSWNATANLPKVSEPGKWEVVGPSYQNHSVTTTAPYWIVLTSGITRLCGNYDWAVISGPQGGQVYILARDVVKFRKDQQQDVLRRLRAMGFDKPNNSPRETYQGPDCIYGPVPPTIIAPAVCIPPKRPPQEQA